MASATIDERAIQDLLKKTYLELQGIEGILESVAENIIRINVPSQHSALDRMVNTIHAVEDGAQWTAVVVALSHTLEFLTGVEGKLSEAMEWAGCE